LGSAVAREELPGANAVADLDLDEEEENKGGVGTLAKLDLPEPKKPEIQIAMLSLGF